MSNWLRRRPLFETPRVKVVQKPKGRFMKPFHWLFRGLRRLCIFLGAIVLFTMVVGFWGASRKEAAPDLPGKMVLVLKLEESLPEKRGAQDYFSQYGLAPSSVTLFDVTNALDKASKDDRVQGFVLSIRSGGYEIAQLQELRAAVLNFKASGKFTKIYAPSYGESGTGLGMYYLASAFDEIWMQPVGVVSISGMNAEMPYFKDVLDKYGVRPQFFQRREYKNAMENLTANEMSPASRRMMTELVNDLGDQIVTGISMERKKVSSGISALVDQGMFTDDEALELGLIDRLDYSDVLLSELEGDKKADRPGFVRIDDYAKLQSKKAAAKNRVAIVHIEGMIMDGGGGSPLSLEDKPANASEIAQSIRDAAEDKSVHTIVIRINSPGGSPSASEGIRRAIVWAKNKHKKPVIVSMGSTAASGGYWIAANADKIYADAGTLTGSIGVVGGKFDLSGLFSKYDIHWDGVSYGQNAGMWNVNRGFDAHAQERFNASLDNIYNHFIEIVADGRKMKRERVEEIAKGRVWTGRQAKEIGLVDQIGGLDMVMDDIAKNKKLSDRHQLSVIELPAPENPLQVFMDMVEKKSPFGAQLGGVEAYLPFLHNERMVYQPLPQL